MEEKSSKAKGVSIVMILLAIVLGFGFVIGLTQTSAANNLTNKDSEISNYAFDENGVLLSYSGQQTEIEIPATYSLSSTVEQVEMSSSSIYTLVDRASSLGILNYSIENQTGNYTDEYGNVYYQEKYVMTYEKRKVVEGDDYQVTGIAANAFSNNTRITSITIPETVRTIGSNSFAGCTNLKTVVLPEYLDRIEDSAFYNCRMLREIEIPNTVSYIGSQAFYYCSSLQQINIPTNITTIYQATFFQCYNLKEVVIPSNVRNIQPEAFYGCTSLEKLTLNEGLVSISSGAFYNCYNLVEIELPTTVNNLTNSAFYRCTNLQTVVIKSPNIVNISSNTFPTSIMNIYVRDELLADYPNYSYWYNYTHCLRPLSEWINNAQ